MIKNHHEILDPESDETADRHIERGDHRQCSNDCGQVHWLGKPSVKRENLNREF